jgi:fucose permease
MILATLMGISMVALGNMANLVTINGTPPAFRGRVLSGMHMMYGIGSLTAPLLASALLERSISWPWVLAGVVPVLLAGCVITGYAGAQVKTQPGEGDWSSVQGDVQVPAEKSPRDGARFGLPQTVVLLVFGSYVVGEVLAVMWLPAYLIEMSGMTAAETGPWVAAFFALMGLSRLACFLFATPKMEKLLLTTALLVPVAAFGLGLSGWIWAFPLAGLCGPFFPLFLARVSRTFAREWQALTVIVVIFIQVILAASHLILGNMIDWLGPQNAFLLPPVSMLLGVLTLSWFFRLERLKSRG